MCFINKTSAGVVPIAPVFVFQGQNGFNRNLDEDHKK